MTEQEWLASSDPAAMLRYLEVGSPGSVPDVPIDRKLRRWVEACRWRVDSNWGDLSVRVGGDAEELQVAVTIWSLSNSWEKEVPLALRADLLREVVGNPWQTISLVCRRCEGCGEVKRGLQGVDEDDWEVLVCPDCSGTGRLPWLTPTVLTLATAAYAGEECGRCGGLGRVPPRITTQCPTCHGTGRLPRSGPLDALDLAVLADALEEAGAPVEVECKRCGGTGHSFDSQGERTVQDCPTCHGTGCLPSPILAHLRNPGPHVVGCWAVDLILGET